MLPSICSHERSTKQPVYPGGIALITPNSIPLNTMSVSDAILPRATHSNAGPVAGEVVLYRFLLPYSEVPAKQDMVLLSHSERSRALSCQQPVKGAMFATGRAQLRRVLAHALNVPPTALKINTEFGGRPCLLSEENELYFNLSYQGQLCVIVLSQQKIGVDVQLLSSRSRAAFQQFFAVELASTELDEARIWVRMEAFGKMTGNGLKMGLRTLFSIATGSCAAPVNCYFLDYKLSDQIFVSVCVAAVTNGNASLSCSINPMDE